jgi:FtsP/CotA-like multicopper oxidase with cupredoxin domain
MAISTSLSRRRLLGGAAVGGAGLIAVGVAAACSTPAAPAAPEPTHTDASHAGVPGGAGDHDAVAAAAVKRFVEGEWQKVATPYGGQPLAPRIEGDTKVFDLTIDAIKHRIDATKDPFDALGYNGTWPGPLLRVVQGDKFRANFTNKLGETTGVHFHGQRLPNKMDGVPLVTQDPIKPGASFVYEFPVRTVGSHMYHSHHNATDQVGRGLLGAFIVEPKDPSERPDRKYGVTQDIVWISNDTLGGFTINGRGFPATKPIVAKLGERIYIRFMNEGVMMHPWHLHGLNMQVVARDGYPLGTAAFTCDTLSVGPGERWDVVIVCDEPGVWAFHCHILPHAEGRDGMYGMVTAVIVQ